MQRKIIFIVIAAVVIAGITVLFLLNRQKAAPLEKVVISVSYDPSSAPIFVARKEGFFREEGIDASLLMHPTGKAALRTMEEGNALFATVADTVLMSSGMENKKILAIATIADSSRHHKVIALKSRGISRPDDLRGRAIGVSERTSGEFFLYSFLLFRDIPASSVRLVNLSPQEMLSALDSGRVDAVATWNPTAAVLEEKLKDNALVFEDDNYLMTWNLVAQREFLLSRPELVQGLLKGLIRAERYIAQHPDDSIGVTAEATGFEAGLLRANWANYHFNIHLGEALLINLEDQARWARKVHYRDRRAIPDFTDFIYTDGLRAVAPEAVAIRGKSIQ